MQLEDNYSRWESYDSEREAELWKVPVCDYCHEHIQTDHFYEIYDEFICPDCMDAHFRKWTDDYIE